MFKRSLVYAYIGAIVVLLLLALSGPIQAQDAEPTADISEAGTGDTQLVFWNGLAGSDGVTLNGMTQAFAEANPGFSVRTEILDWEVLYQKLQASLVAGDAPDLVLMHTSEMPQFVNFGALQPVDFIYGTGEGQIDPADFSPTALAAMHSTG